MTDPTPGAPRATEERRVDFDAWWLELRDLADSDPAGDSAGPDKESFREFWEEGYDPTEAYDIVWEDMRR